MINHNHILTPTKITLSHQIQRKIQCKVTILILVAISHQIPSSVIFPRNLHPRESIPIMIYQISCSRTKILTFKFMILRMREWLQQQAHSNSKGTMRLTHGNNVELASRYILLTKVLNHTILLLILKLGNNLLHYRWPSWKALTLTPTWRVVPPQISLYIFKIWWWSKGVATMVASKPNQMKVVQVVLTTSSRVLSM
jgi:hypothetical protein